MPDNEIHHELGGISSKLDILHDLIQTHLSDDKAVEARVRYLEQNTAKFGTLIALVGAILGIAGSALLKMIKFS